MLRESVLKLSKHKCMVTNFNEVECDVAHIVPRSVSGILELDNSEFENNPHNCLLLSKSAHCLFDKFMWSVDVFSMKVINLDMIMCDILLNDELKKLKTVMSLAKKQICVHYKTFAYLYLHYHVFLIKNYLKPTMSVINIMKYHLKVESHFSKYLGMTSADEMEKYTKRQNTRKYRVILSKRGYGEEYLVLWDFKSMSHSSWIRYDDFEDVTGIEFFETLHESICDPDYN